MNIPTKKINIKDFAPLGSKSCEGKCDRIILKGKMGPIIVCNFCKRIVIDSNG